VKFDSLTRWKKSLTAVWKEKTGKEKKSPFVAGAEKNGGLGGRGQTPGSKQTPITVKGGSRGRGKPRRKVITVPVDSREERILEQNEEANSLPTEEGTL